LKVWRSRVTHVLSLPKSSVPVTVCQKLGARLHPSYKLTLRLVWSTQMLWLHQRRHDKSCSEHLISLFL
jgi:hypothetical protein